MTATTNNNPGHATEDDVWLKVSAKGPRTPDGEIYLAYAYLLAREKSGWVATTLGPVRHVLDPKQNKAIAMYAKRHYFRAGSVWVNPRALLAFRVLRGGRVSLVFSGMETLSEVDSSSLPGDFTKISGNTHAQLTWGSILQKNGSLKIGLRDAIQVDALFLPSLQAVLSDMGWMSHRSSLVNPAHLCGYKKNEVFLTGGTVSMSGFSLRDQRRIKEMEWTVRGEFHDNVQAYCFLYAQITCGDSKEMMRMVQGSLDRAVAEAKQKKRLPSGKAS